MSTGHDTSDFAVVQANRELRQRLAQAEHTAELLRADLLSMTRLADQQYLREQELATGYRWLKLVVEHIQAGKPLPEGWRGMSVNALVKHVLEYQTNARKTAQKKDEGKNDERISNERPAADADGDAGRSAADRPAAARLGVGGAADAGASDTPDVSQPGPAIGPGNHDEADRAV